MKKYQLLTGNMIKIIAVISMFIDHFHKIIIIPLYPKLWASPIITSIFSESQIVWINKLTKYTLYGLGRLAFPLFCFLLTEGFYYTKNRKHYIGLMALFALISEIPFDLALYGRITRILGQYAHQNVFFTLFLGLLALWCIEKLKSKSDKIYLKLLHIIPQAICVYFISMAASFFNTDYRFRGILFIVTFYLTRKNRILQVLSFLLVYSLAYKALPSIFIILSCVPVLLYNGERGKSNLKYFFYIFYPAHFCILYFLSLVI